MTDEKPAPAALPKMTVGDLIAALQAFAPNMPVVVSGYEMGFDDPIIRPVDLMPTDWPAWYNGAWNEADAGEPCFSAIAIERPEKNVD